ncbi:pyridoxamine 5'-phosphate oxidase family protein [Microbacterium sp. JB110]|uniref:pyridoxamine 5'-phosphate oxidase family protein n=1 Tax=Microbacterium sp. JB110 TaxID=2024477 RepID=UPI00097F4073|nr:pyridoxamine 5'-phosphate oxidase family protein [Microbacterium sp. JB110]RCS60905.1 PPOX class F420-dependent oxidoreductase [Microbacterium sp. JB110]SJM64144.1 hypothetical protein CZ774_12500 [Frigoribacterium sp. JB110]
MPRTPLPSEYLDALRKPNQCVVATIRPNGELSTAATWYELTDDSHILLNLDATRARMRHMREDPRVALTIFAADDWYSHVSLSGEVVEFRKDDGLVDIDRISEHYTGAPYADRERDSWSVVIRISSWHAWHMPKISE